jgi:hypothetical protein
MPDSMSPSRLWKRMTFDQRLAAARAFWNDEQAADDHVQAVLLIAQQKKFRPKTVLSLELERKARHLASVVSLSDGLAARILVVYHIAEQRPMMSAFLDALDIRHDNGVIEDDVAAPAPEKIGSAAAALAERFPPDSVSLYLNTLFSQDPETWGALGDVPQRQL